jgi:hypothetical protein
MNNGRFTMALLASLAGSVILTAPALGDVQSVTPYFAVATEKASAHCGSNDRFYRIGDLTPAQVVMVDGEGEGWSRISYPSSLTAFVRVEDVKVENGIATLTGASKLKATNAASGYGGSWKALMDSPMPAGTTLKVIEPAKEGETIVGYKIAAPETARAFVESRTLRRASDAEVEAFKTKGTLPSIPAATGSTPGSTPGATTPGSTPNSTTPGSTPVTGPVAVKPETVKTVPAKPEDRMIGNIETLEATFAEVWKQPVMTAEVGELRAEYERAATAASAKPELQAMLQKRVDALDLRIKARDTIRKQEEARASIDKKKSELSEEVAAWEKTRVYTVVGELQPSTVYDGKRLPLMYRVVSVGGSSVRTLGYLKASKDIDLTKMIGQVIGVIGDSTMDRSLMLNIIDPVRVVTLKETAASTPDAAPSASVEEKPDNTPAKSNGG